MAQLLPVAFALPLAILFGGRLRRVGRLELRGIWLFFLAIGIQIVAFPFAFLPWTTAPDTAKALWLVSYGCLLVAAALNRHILGAQIVAAGMALNLAAILSNGGRRPATPEAMEAAGLEYAVRHNSIASSEPALPWLVDRFAAPEWVPWANVFSVGDAVIALGSVVLVFAATGARIPGVRRPTRAVSSSRGGPRRPRLPRPWRRGARGPVEVAAAPDLVGREEEAQIATLPAQSARHESDGDEYARKRVEARGGPAEIPLSDGAFPGRRAFSRRHAPRRAALVTAGLVAAGGIALVVASRRRRASVGRSRRRR
jgi:hypothetical protein